MGCLVLKETAIAPSGSRDETVITQLSLVEPPMSLFQVPLKFVERTPGDVERLYEQRFPGHKLYTDTILKQVQQRYLDSRK